MSSTGRIMKDSEHKEEEETKKNGNGANGNGSGNGDSSGSSDGGGVSEGWSSKYKRSIDCDNPKGFSQRAHCQGRKKVNEAKEKGDHEISMAQSQLKKSERNIAKLRKVLGKKERNIPAWVQAKITDTEHNTDAAAGYMDEGKRDGKSAKSKDYSLHDWFKGGGWVQAGGKYDGKPCAKQPGQKTKPFCRDADDRASMSKDERNKRAAKKRKEDPNPNRKGKAKMVSASYSNWRVELQQLDEFFGPKTVTPRQGESGSGTKSVQVGKRYPARLNGQPVVKIYDKTGKSSTKPMSSIEKIGLYRKYGHGQIGPINQSFELKGDLVDEVNIGYSNPSIKGKPILYPKGHPKEGKPMSFNRAETEGKQRYDDYNRRHGTKIRADQPLPEEKIEEGKKDACYHKVKSRYKVWPSAYASGALVKCRKVGAKNWGNSTNEGYEFSNWRDDFQAMEFESVDIIEAEPLQSTESVIDEKAQKCWKGYEKKGTKKMFGKTYNNCVKKEEVELQEKKSKKDACKGKPKRWQDSDCDGKWYEKGEDVKEDWQKSNRNDGVDGMSQKSVNTYRRENPESKLQTAVTGKVKKGSKDAKRRKSFCDRSDGQRKMHNIDCSKTPEKKICKARKRWRC
jgi:hypothetical protein